MPSTPERLTIELLDRTRQAPVSDLELLLTTATKSMVELGVADWASLSERLGDSEFKTWAATDDRAVASDRLQYDHREGPGVQAIHENGLLWSDDIARDTRWPRWGPAAAAEGIGAVISVHLFASGETIGSLNLSWAKPRHLTSDDLELARTVAIPLSIELAHARQDGHLWRAIDARHRIGQAQGILMERFHISPDRAFAVLRRISQHRNTKLHLIADQLIQTRVVPGDTDAEGSTPA